MKTIIFIDTETTGLNITTDRIIQISLIKTNLELEILEKKKLLLSNCGVPVHPKAFEAHGISEKDLEGKHPFSAYAKQIFSYLDESDFIGGYNIKGFDIPILYEEFSRSGLEWNPKPIIDSCIIFKKREERTLFAALKFYCGLEFGEGQAHDAENDVLATIDVLRGQIKKYQLNEIIELSGESYSVQNRLVPVWESLVFESQYENESKRLSWDGKILLGENEAIWGFGKFKDLPLNRADLNYINWFLSSDFPSQSKNVLRKFLNK